MMRPDLHMHSTASDGTCTPYELARLVQRADVTLFSVTDHDTMTGIPEAIDAAYERGLAFIPGVEISTEGDEEVHILGYGVKYNDPVLTAFFDQMEQERIKRFRTMGKRLIEQGYELPLDNIMSSAGASIGRPHLARALVAAGYVQNTQEAFQKLIGKGCYAYVPRDYLAASKAVSLLRERGAVPVCAHPGLIRWPIEKLLPMIKAWQDAGLMGIEVYHPANKDNYAMWDRLARERRLLVTGGSDYHDGSPGHGLIGETIPAWRTAGEDGWALFQAVRQKN
ncbi:MAG: PHP domain-containing protein [Clostridia bacterium]|nr:PHP domain-containing protein [Clostridia bacterium]